MSRIDPFPDLLRRYLAGFVARQRAVLATRCLGYTVGALIAWLFVACLLDRAFQLPEAGRWIAFAVALVLAASGLIAATWQLLRQVDWNVVAERIESHTDVFGERLRTVTSRLLVDDQGRSSRALLRQTVDDVGRILPTISSKDLLPWRRALGPWVLAVMAGVVLSIAALMPGWHFDLLLARTLFPHRAIDPVTSIQMRVSPKNVSVSPAETVTIAVDVAPEQAAMVQPIGVDLYLSSDRKNWSRAVMAADGVGRYRFAIPSIERDLSYYVQTGRARSDLYAVQVHRVPAVKEFRIRYDYPDYANHSPANVTNTDGSIECLANSTATVRIVANEALESATWILNGDRLPMSPTDRAEEWTVSLPIMHDGSSSLEMVSSAGVGGRGPSPMNVRAVPDEAPRPSIVTPSVDLCLQPGDATSVRFFATDDYGLHALSCHIRVNGRDVAAAAVPISTRPLRRDGEFMLDLATLHVSTGDVVTLIVEAEDEWRQSKFSEAKTILVAPKSVTAADHHLIDELKRSESACKTWLDSVEQCRRTIGLKRPDDLVRAMATVNDGASALRQSLLRAIMRADSPRLADALSAWVDRAQGISVDLARAEGLPHRLEHLIAQGGAMLEGIKGATNARRAAVLETQWDNYTALASAPSRNAVADPAATEAVELHDKALARLKDSINAERAALGVKPGSDLFQQLQRLINQGDEALARARQPDWSAAAQQWAARSSKSDGAEASAELSARLGAASVATALRIDGDVQKAHNLLLAARAVSHVRGNSVPARSALNKKPAPQTAPSRVMHVEQALRELLAGKNPEAGRKVLEAHADWPDVSLREALSASLAMSRRDFGECAAHDAALAAEIAKQSPDDSARFQQDLAQLDDMLRDLDSLVARQTALQGEPDIDAQRRLADDAAVITWPVGKVPVANAPVPSKAALVYDDAPAGNLSTKPSERRPLEVAAWLSRDAVAAMVRAPESKEVADDQQRVIDNLNRAAVELIRRATLRRLAEVPSLAPLFPAPNGDAANRFDFTSGWTKQWQRLESRPSVPAARDASTANLDDQLRAYFEAISKAQKEHH